MGIVTPPGARAKRWNARPAAAMRRGRLAGGDAAAAAGGGPARPRAPTVPHRRRYVTHRHHTGGPRTEAQPHATTHRNRCEGCGTRRDAGRWRAGSDPLAEQAARCGLRLQAPAASGDANCPAASRPPLPLSRAEGRGGPRHTATDAKVAVPGESLASGGRDQIRLRNRPPAGSSPRQRWRRRLLPMPTAQAPCRRRHREMPTASQQAAPLPLSRAEARWAAVGGAAAQGAAHAAAQNLARSDGARMLPPRRRPLTPSAQLDPQQGRRRCPGPLRILQHQLQ